VANKNVLKRFVDLILIGLVVASAGCSSNKGVTPDGKDGSGTAAGTIGARSFETVADARWIGAPDDPKQTRVIYVFDKQVSCSALSAAGWDEVVTDQTQALEMKLIGTAPGTYPVNTRPATGEADVNYTVTSTSGTPSEVSATGGSVVVEQFLADEAADGTFDLTIPGGTVSGTFHATYCATGREP
jgi:hypothetical protein